MLSSLVGLVSLSGEVRGLKGGAQGESLTLVATGTSTLCIGGATCLPRLAWRRHARGARPLLLRARSTAPTSTTVRALAAELRGQLVPTLTLWPKQTNGGCARVMACRRRA